MKLAHLDRNDSLHLKATGVYEPFWTDLFKRTFKPGQTFVDVGAHIGYYTAMAAEAGAGEIHAFEPDPDNYRLLEQNCREVANLYELAVSDRTGRAMLYRCVTNSGDHRLFETEGRESVEVGVTRLDDVRELAGRCVDFVKIDAQGEETRILRGAAGLLERSPNVVGIVELAPEHLALGGSSAKELLCLLGELGFSVYVKRERVLVPGVIEHLVDLRRHINLFIRRRGAG